MKRYFIFAFAFTWSVAAFAKPDDAFARTELTCLALNIYHEARGEIATGQLAVGMVTMNRVLSPAYPKSVCAVVYQPKQFSWTGEKAIEGPRDVQAWRAAQRVADFIYHKYPAFHRGSKGAIDITRGAVHFYAPKHANPQWAQNTEITREIGGHRFVRAKS